MIVGDPAQFAIEFGILNASEMESIRATGFFNIIISGYKYGLTATDSTTLACSFDEIEHRISHRGTHTAPFSAEPDAGLIAESVRNALYEEGRGSYFGLPLAAFSDLIYDNHLLWAPDGDEAFDDGSYVLQFDRGNQVRLIGFKSHAEFSYDRSTLRDVWISQNSFYDILKQWSILFETQRMSILNSQKR
jgi:hypothetical protein